MPKIRPKIIWEICLNSTIGLFSLVLESLVYNLCTETGVSDSSNREYYTTMLFGLNQRVGFPDTSFSANKANIALGEDNLKLGCNTTVIHDHGRLS